MMREIGAWMGVIFGLLCLGSGPAAAAPAPDSELIGCERAGEKLVLTRSSHLDPSCTYTKGIQITASDVVLDCQGARIVDVQGTQGRGIFITTPVDVPMANVRVTGCHVEGFLNNMRVERLGWKEAITEGAEYEAPLSNIVIEDSTLLGSRGSGIFVNAYVTGVTMRDLVLRDSEGVGIYLEAGSKESVVEDCLFDHNGFEASTEEDIPIVLGPMTVNVDILGREGLAIDGSRFNTVRGNVFTGNAAGGIFLYKNCGEYARTEPEQHWERWTGADGNLISGNTFVGEAEGIWVGSRMAQNTLFMDCSDPWYYRAPLFHVVLDYAADNTLLNNTFIDVDRAIRIEDDGTTVEGNFVSSADPEARAIILGTYFRTRFLDAPVRNSVIYNNQAEIPGNANPYTWIHGHESTAFEGNLANGEPATLSRGRQPEATYHVFVEGLSFEPTGGLSEPSQRPMR